MAQQVGNAMSQESNLFSFCTVTINQYHKNSNSTIFTIYWKSDNFVVVATEDLKKLRENHNIGTDYNFDVYANSKQVTIYCDHLQTEFNYKSKTQGELPKQCGVRSKKGRVSLRRACSWSSGGFAPIFSTLSSSLWCNFVDEVNLIIDIAYF